MNVDAIITNPLASIAVVPEAKLLNVSVDPAIVTDPVNVSVDAVRIPFISTLFVNVLDDVNVFDSVEVTPVRWLPSPKKAEAVTLDVARIPPALVLVMLDNAVNADPIVLSAFSRVSVLSVPLDALVANAVVIVEKSTPPDPTVTLVSADPLPKNADAVTDEPVIFLLLSITVTPFI